LTNDELGEEEEDEGEDEEEEEILVNQFGSRIVDYFWVFRFDAWTFWVSLMVSTSPNEPRSFALIAAVISVIHFVPTFSACAYGTIDLNLLIIKIRRIPPNPNDFIIPRADLTTTT
jgi:hypothetical protein